MSIPSFQVVSTNSKITSYVTIDDQLFIWDRDLTYDAAARRMADSHYDRLEVSRCDPRRDDLRDAIRNRKVDPL